MYMFPQMLEYLVKIIVIEAVEYAYQLGLWQE